MPVALGGRLPVCFGDNIANWRDTHHEALMGSDLAIEAATRGAAISVHLAECPHYDGHREHWFSTVCGTRVICEKHSNCVGNNTMSSAVMHLRYISCASGSVSVGVASNSKFEHKTDSDTFCRNFCRQVWPEDASDAVQSAAGERNRFPFPSRAPRPLRRFHSGC